MTGGIGQRIRVCAWGAALLGVFVFCLVSVGYAGPAVAVQNRGPYLLAKAGSSGDNAGDDQQFLDDDNESQETIHVADPLRGWNHAMFVFNDRAYFWVLKPVAKGYKAVVPQAARIGIHNFFYNLLMPVRFVNCILQGKGQAATGEFGRFMLNSTVGVLGFGNPAAKYPKLNPDAEDLGQTLGKYGVGNGIYLVWPILGPSTLRDSVGDFFDWFLDPVSYVQPALAQYGIKAGKDINKTSLHLGEYESMKAAAFDPYTAFRDAYLQYRQAKIKK